MRKFLLALMLVLSLTAPSYAGTTNLDSLTLDSNLTVTGTTTHTGAVTNSGNVTVGGTLAVTGASTMTGVVTLTAKPVLSTATISANGDTITIQDLGNANIVQSEGAQTINGVKTFGSAPVLSTATITANGDTITIQDLGNANIVQTEGTQTINGTKTFGTPLLGASLNAAVRRHTAVWPVNGAAGSVLADGTTYKGYIPIGRASTVTGVHCLCGTAPVGGTNTIKVLKASATGNTMLSAATLDPTTLVNDAITTPSLTATGADLGLTAAQGVYLEWVTGTQTTDGVNCSIAVEYTLTDF